VTGVYHGRMSDPVEDLAAAIDTVLEVLVAVQDPVSRERLARRLADDLLPAAVKRVSEVRQGAVVELRDDRYKLREIAEMLDLSVSRVNQIARGNK
jgi:DNA-directed RNA polymerase specialized sigma24 family protein